MAKKPVRRRGLPRSLSGSFDEIRGKLADRLISVRKTLSENALKLDRQEMLALASILVEFTEDLHCGIGIWQSLERSNQRLFGTSLPFILEQGKTLPPEKIVPERFRHFLWVWFGEVAPDVFISPDHPDLITLAATASKVLRDEFANISRTSVVREFLRLPIVEGWDVKEKLIWLGTQSYLLRTSLKNYLEGKGLDESASQMATIATIDDFLAQECTQWAGLGVLEILDGLLTLREEQRADLRGWSERHFAVYKVLSATKDRVQLLNLINDREYRVRINLEPNPFGRGQLFFGSLVPWDGDWCWSGAQKRMPILNRLLVDKIKRENRMRPSVYFRDHPEDLKKAREIVHEMSAAFVARHGKNWCFFPDAQALADDWQNSAIEKYESLDPIKKKQFLKKHKLKEGQYKVNLPPELFKLKGGIGVYFNPEAGQETFEQFDQVLSGLAKKGIGLTTLETEMIRRLVVSENMSPGFVTELAEEFGGESIMAAFGLEGQHQDYALNYLLRRYKGRSFRPQYPNISMVE